MKKSVLIFFVVLCLYPTSTLYSQRATTFFSPGIKLGYTFGEKGGFTYGLEFSYVWMDRTEHNIGNSVGPVLDIDFWPGASRVHLGVERVYVGAYGGPAYGVCLGPSMVSTDEKVLFGFSVIPFAGWLAYPYFNYTWTSEHTFTEAGLYLKAHFHTGKDVFQLIH